LITGGSGDLGKVIALQLARTGLHVFVHANSHLDRAEAVAAEICAQGGQAQALAFDLTDPAATRAMLEPLAAEVPFQIIVHSAGVHHDAPMAGMTEATWRRVLEVSLNGFFHVTQPLLLPMLRTRWGRVIAISSVAGQLGNRGQSNYAAAKAGLHGACLSLAKEVAARGVTVNVVAPGIITSRMTEGIFDDAKVKMLVPAGRMGRPEEVAAVVAFLASEAASYVSGQIIGVNGAMA
jgi:3-oxoacyl-[acyl-carrier protein] reductase